MLELLWEDGERAFYRMQRPGNQSAVLAVRFAAQHFIPASLDRLAHEYSLREELESAWAARPLEVVHEGGQPLLLLEDGGGVPLSRLLGEPIETGHFLHLAIRIAAALAKVHQRNLLHKDLKPANILVSANGEVRLTGFGIASRLSRERQAPEPPETIAGTLAYMAPEQTGRMNRSVDARSDLYALGVTFYQMLTGSLPFTAAQPMEWVHCHIARKPTPPAERLASIPVAVSAMVMKLLAKTAEERYQTAVGVERDLRRCLAEWEAQGHIEDFPLAQLDTPDRLLIPEILYGREREVETLLCSFDRVIKSGRPELVLVSGYSGMGKSSVVNELHRMLVPPRGLFAAGKFDQYKRDIPYSTLAQAFQSLMRSLLGKSEAELADWRVALLEALGPNGRLIADVVPDLKFIIGDQPPVPDLSPQDSQRRFQLVLQRFIGVFAQAEHPLALFLDDLQWLDAATLELLEDMLIRSDLHHLMLIGAYRDNEVAAGHPLMRRLDAIKAGGGKIEQISLAPLSRRHLNQLIADALHCEPARAATLSQLVHEKTGGNPFFAIQFLTSLADEGMLAFEHDAARWCWDLERIHAKGYTDNVVDLMVGKLNRLPAQAQTALRQLACLGNIADFAEISIALGTTEEQVHTALWPAVRLELIERLSGAYKFVHDRIQEAAYSLIPEEQRREAHLRIGRLLAAHVPTERREEAVFDIVNHLNRGATLITSQEERDQLAELNLSAGKRAKASTAYASALTYLNAGAALVAEDCWERRHELAFSLEINLAECEFLTGELKVAEERLAALSRRTAKTAELATVASLLVDLHTALDQSSFAIAVALDYLRHLGIDWSSHPTNEEARREYERVWAQLGSRSIESLIDLPLMSDPVSLATLDVLTKIQAPAVYTDANLLALVACRAVNLSLECGNCDASCSAYVWLSMVAGPCFGDYRPDAYRFGQLGYDLVEKRGLSRYAARTYEQFALGVVPWTRHVRAGRDLLRRAFAAANQMGDVTYAAYCCDQLNTNFLAAGDPLSEAQGEAEQGLAFAQKMRFGLVIDAITTQLGLIRTLRGLTPTFGSFDDEQFNEFRIERHFSENPDLAFVESWYWIRKMQARFFAGDYAAAIEASLRAQPVLWASVLQFESAEYHFYDALSQAAFCDCAAIDERQQHLGAVAAHHKQLQLWAANCPENFENRAALVGAELARLENRELDAGHLYEQAIRSARANGFIHQEAIAYELAARFYAVRGFEEFAHTYLRKARDGYLRWGADGKVRQLEQMHPHLAMEEREPRPTSTIGAPVEHLDLATVLKVSQAVSGEIVVLEKLIDMLLRTAVEHAGAERGLLILPQGAELQIHAEATTRGDAVTITLHHLPVSVAEMPEPIIRYVARTQEIIILDDASARGSYCDDAYVRRNQARSVLCLPIVKQGKSVAVLYLENNLAARVFTPARVSVLKLLASEAATSLENNLLYRELQEREAKIRRLVDANIVGIFMYDLDGRILEANDAFLRIVAYDRDDLMAGRLQWTQLTPPEWLELDRQVRVPELRATGTLKPFEKEYFRKDGSRVSVLIGAAVFEESGDRGVAFVLDLSERKRAEAEARESERRYREVQMELAHASRAATMGQLTASIAHEVKQPIGAVAANAAAAFRWLGAQPPNLPEARHALDRIVNDMLRAGDIISRIRDLIQKAPPRKDSVNINEAVRDVIELTRSEASKNGVSVLTVLGDNLPDVLGDRVQLQQVMLNLIVNAVEAMSGVSDGARELRISTCANPSSSVAVSLRDSGPGLDPATLERLFEAFYTTKPSGMGMGLSICRSIIEAHGGRIWASVNEPHGAVFEFTVPAQSEHA
jgi:PAS domain S-box-containing protein